MAHRGRMERAWRVHRGCIKGAEVDVEADLHAPCAHRAIFFVCRSTWALVFAPFGAQWHGAVVTCALVGCSSGSVGMVLHCFTLDIVRPQCD